MSTLFAHFPRPSDISHGMETSLLLLRLKWRTIHSRFTKLFIWLGFIVVTGVIFMAAHTGYLIRTIAQGPDDTTAVQQMAMTYLASFMRGELGTLGAGALGLSVLSAIIAPFTGAVSTSLISTRELVPFGLTKWHRFTDSLISQFFSSISILQLIALTTISSLLTLQGGREMGMLLTWATWLVLVFLSVTSVWAAELLYRRFGFKMRSIILIGSLGAVGLALLLDENHGTTLFGLGNLYAYLIQHIGLSADTKTIAMTFGILALTAVILLTAGAWLSSIALSRPENVALAKSTVVKKVRVRKTAKIAEVELIRFLIRSVLRSSETRKPLIAASGLGVVMVIITAGTYTVATTFTVMIPLIVALSWGSNVFGLLGGGTVWLASQPRLFARMPWLLFAAQASITLVLFLIVWGPGLISGRVPLDMLPGIFLAAASSTALVTRSSVQKSIFSPHPTYFGVRGETLLPPAATLNYTFRFAMWSGQYGVIVLTLDDLFSQVSLAFLAIAWSAFRMTRIQEKWNNPLVRRDVMTTVAQD